MSIVIVSGMGRCGSSLVMQMLKSGGLPLTSEASEVFCEDNRVYTTDMQWLRDLNNVAVKILAPDLNKPPTGLDAKGIWVRRNINQQVASWAKTVALKGKERSKASMRRQIMERTGPCIQIMHRVCSGLMFVDFESILAGPLVEAKKISEFVGGLDAKKMASVVVNRSPKARKDFLESRLRKRVIV